MRRLWNGEYRLPGWFLALGWILLLAGLLVPRVAAVGSGGYRSLETFANVVAIVRQNYVREVTTETLVSGAIEGMLSSLDPYSAYLAEEAYRELQTETEGRFGGLGLEVTVRNGFLTVISPIEDTPAARAGVQPGDQIIEIDDQSTEDIGLADAVTRLRGPRGSSVTISIRRVDHDKPLRFTIVRDVIEINSVRAHVLESGFLYVRIAQFQDRTSENLKAALARELPDGEAVRGLVLDLRNNPGGLLGQAVEVSDLFLESGLIVYTDGRPGQQKQKFSASPQGSRTDFPMVVLVNGGSASASEIVAGALQDHKRALILGTRTFGKGSVQTILPLDGRSALRLTTAEYFTPDGRSIHETGIRPDIVMDRKARPSDRAEASGGSSETGGPEPGAMRGEGIVERTRNDPQVGRALELLKGWDLFRGLAGPDKAT